MRNTKRSPSPLVTEAQTAEAHEFSPTGKHERQRPLSRARRDKRHSDLGPRPPTSTTVEIPTLPVLEPIEPADLTNNPILADIQRLRALNPDARRHTLGSRGKLRPGSSPSSMTRKLAAVASRDDDFMQSLVPTRHERSGHGRPPTSTGASTWAMNTVNLPLASSMVQTLARTVVEDGVDFLSLTADSHGAGFRKLSSSHGQRLPTSDGPHKRRPPTSDAAGMVASASNTVLPQSRLLHSSHRDNVPHLPDAKATNAKKLASLSSSAGGRPPKQTTLRDNGYGMIME